MRRISHPGLRGRGESGVVNCRKWHFNVRNLSPCDVPSWRAVAGPSHLSQAASYITHCSCPPLHLRPPETEAWESQGESAADASGLLFNLAATQQSGTHLSPALKVILNWLTHIHVSPRPVIEMNCGQQPPGCLERLKAACPVPLWRAGPAHTPNPMCWKGGWRGLQCYYPL